MCDRPRLNRRNTGRRWPKTPYRRSMRRRFPKATIIQGDAYDIRETLDGIVTEPGASSQMSFVFGRIESAMPAPTIGS